MELPESRYARTIDGVAIAYQVVGGGEHDIVLATSAWVSNFELGWDWPELAEIYRALAARGRLVLFDRRGSGLSDKVSGDRLPTLEARMDDIRAVMDAAGSQRAVLYGMEDGAAQCLLFAATYPQRTEAVITSAASSRGVWAPDAPWLWTHQQWDEEIRLVERTWGTSELARAIAEIASPIALARNPQFVSHFARAMRHSLSPADAVAADQMWRDIDVRHVLPAIQAPALIMHATGDRLESIDEARFIAAQIPSARLVEMPGSEHFTVGDLAEIDRFLASLDAEREVFDRVLATVLFTDIVDSTATAARLGDHAWRGLLDRHHAAIGALLGRYRGELRDTAGDGVFATFDGPARGVRCALAIVEAMQPLGIEVRAGLHTGELEADGDQLKGIAIHIGARVCAVAGGSQVLVSQTVKDLVVGSGIEFAAAGEHELKGVPERRTLHRAVPS